MDGWRKARYGGELGEKIAACRGDTHPQPLLGNQGGARGGFAIAG